MNKIQTKKSKILPAMILPLLAGLGHLAYSVCLTAGHRQFLQMSQFMESDEATYQAARETWLAWSNAGDKLLRFFFSPLFLAALAVILLLAFRYFGVKGTLISTAAGLALCWAASLPFALILGNKPNRLGSGDYLLLVRFTTLRALLALAASGALAGLWLLLRRKIKKEQ